MIMYGIKTGFRMPGAQIKDKRVKNKDFHSEIK